MRIKSLEISGFKSFCDRTRILFDHAVTAVVGPNGCGKSNIVDAIRWALGEQSAKNLRGKGMGDVIFNGSEKRGPKSRAEVTVTFDNTDGLSHPLYADYPEIAVTRVLHRDGTSEYRINKTPCRLKDITDLFMGTGGGARAYSIIEQGRIGLIVSSRSEDRRAMIEEAAGVTRFKKARDVAVKKMEQTRQNLLRVNDVIAEMAKSQESLRRQAAKAERYRAYAGELRDLELYLAGFRYLELRAKAQTIGLQARQAEAVLSQRRDQLAAVEARLEQLRLEETRAHRALEEARDAAAEVNREIAVIETEMRHLRDGLHRLESEEAALAEQQAEAERRKTASADERDVLSARLDALHRDAQAMRARREEADARVAEAKERLAELGAQFDALRDAAARARTQLATARSTADALEQRVADVDAQLAELAREQEAAADKTAALTATAQTLAAQIAQARQRVTRTEQSADAAAQRLESLREQVAACEQERQRLQATWTARSSRLESLREMRAALERHGNGVRQAVAALEKAGYPFGGVLVDSLRCDDGFDIALSAVLADRLSALLVEGVDEGVALLDWLKERDLGRVTVLARGVSGQDETSEDVPDVPGVIGWLADHVTAEGDLEAAVRRLVAGVLVVEDTRSALAAWRSGVPHVTVVTRDGQVLGADGSLSGGRPQTPGVDLLAQQREIRELEEETARLRSQLDAVDERFETLRDEFKRCSQDAERYRRELQEARFALEQQEREHRRAEEDVREFAARREGIARRVEALQAQRGTMLRDLEQAAAQAEQAETAIADSRYRIEEQSAHIDALREEADRLAAQATDARVREAQFQQQYEAAKERSTHIAQLEEELRAQQERIAQRRFQVAYECGKLAGRLFAFSERLDGLVAAVSEREDQVRRCAAALDACCAVSAETAEEARRVRKQVEEATSQCSHWAREADAVRSEEHYLLANVRERHDVELPRVLGDYHWRPLPGPQEVERVAELKELIAKMGAINPNAIEEYAEVSARYEEKVAQKEDIEQALEDLETAISRMERDSKRLFKETFDAVNAQFQKIFPRLFKGGSAELRLTDPDDLLTTGVDIVASPPGKKLRAIELMSGGEKALTAVSLLFAIFLQRPSPFCLLDEVDAPLDDANISRFIDMVREMTNRSQFIIITHSKLTMEGADTLYGVTMQEPGVSKILSVSLVRDDSFPRAANG